MGLLRPVYPCDFFRFPGDFPGFKYAFKGYKHAGLKPESAFSSADDPIKRHFDLS